MLHTEPCDIAKKSKQNNNLSILTCALDYIESHLEDDFSQEELAKACYCSLSSVQKLWKYCTHSSIKEYVIKRRLTNAAKKLLDTDMTILDIAVQYGYNSNEAFTRAFTKLWGYTPSDFRKGGMKSCGLYPKLNKDYFTGADIMGNKKFDINEAFDYFVSMAGTYVLCFDIEGLNRVNIDIGRDVGDMVILEVLKRLNDAAEEKTVLRIGGDEFVLFTETDNIDDVNVTANKILANNGKPVTLNGISQPVNVRCGAVMIRNPLKYTGLLADFDEVINKARMPDAQAISFI